METAVKYFIEDIKHKLIRSSLQIAVIASKSIHDPNIQRIENVALSHIQQIESIIEECFKCINENVADITKEKSSDVNYKFDYLFDILKTYPALNKYIKIPVKEQDL